MAKSVQKRVEDALKTTAVIRWEPAVIAYSEPKGIPYQFSMAYLAAESEGNPCEIGRDDQFGDEGQPREIGLFQLYNPDDFRALGIKPSSFRTYCNGRKLTRSMTSKEVQAHVEAGIRNIERHRRAAEGYMRQAGGTYSTSSKDYWRFVKLVHALPVIIKALPVIATKLGKAPSWREFRSEYAAMNPRARYDADKAEKGIEQDGYYRALENAEVVGGFAPEKEVA